MGILLYRVDERLIHGQVVIGWGSHLRAERYLVADDDLAGSDWEQELYRLGAGEAEVVFRTVAGARDALAEWRAAPKRSILLTRDVESMLGLAAGGRLRGERVNLGGQLPAPDRERVLTYLHLSPRDREGLGALTRAGVEVSAQDLPDAHRVPLTDLSEP